MKLKNKVKIKSIIVLMVLLIIFVIPVYKKLTKEKIILKESSISKSNLISFMLETGAGSGTYNESQTTAWPLEGYEFNSEKSYCNNGSIISYLNNKISIKAVGEDKCYAFFDVYFRTFNEIILENNGGVSNIESKATPNYAQSSYSNDGMFLTQDNYGKSYYFRGAVDNNWVLFSGIYWRIIRINGNGSVRLFYSGAVMPTSSESVVQSGSSTGLQTSRFNGASSSGSDNKSKNLFNYTTGAAKTSLEAWYGSTLSQNSNYIDDSGFCNDRTGYADSFGTTPDTQSYTFYGGFVRLANSQTSKNPSLLCPNYNLTVASGALQYPIGLITADEIVMAGNGRVGVDENSTNYNYAVFTYRSYGYWTMTPYSFQTYANVFNQSGGYLNYDWPGQTLYLIPVISIKSQVNVTGSGLWNDPYVVQ